MYISPCFQWIHSYLAGRPVQLVPVDLKNLVHVWLLAVCNLSSVIRRNT